MIQDIQQLRSVGYAHAGDWVIPLPNGTLICREVLRAVPNRRLVILGEWQKQKVVAKLFYTRDAKRHAKREIENAKKLVHTDIKTPAVLFHGETGVNHVYAIVFEYLSPDLDLDEIWCGEDPEKLKYLLFSMQEIIAGQHQAGIYHHDLHPHNFLMHDNQLFLMDLSSIKQGFLHRLSRKTCLKNLAKFYAQLYLKYHDVILEVFGQYCRLRGWTDLVQLEKQLLSLLQKALYARMRETQKRYLRDCTYVVGEKTFRKRLFCVRNYYTEDMKTFLQNPDNAFQPENLIKQGHTCTIAKIRLNGQGLVVKRYNIKGFRHFIRRCFRSSRAVRSWQNAHMLKVLGIATPKAVAMLEKRYGFFAGAAYYIYTYVPGELLKTFFEQTHHSDELRHQVAQAMSRELQLFKMARLAHGDMKNTNFILQNIKPILLDLDAMQIYACYARFKKRYQKDLRRFLKNWDAQPKIHKLFLSLLTQIKV